MLDIVPCIFENELEKIEEKIGLVAPFVQWVQIDFSDGTLIPARTFFDPEELSSIISKNSKTGLGFEAHLMTSSPERHISVLARAGFKRVVAHIECVDSRLFLNEARFESVEAGLAIDGPTEMEQLEPFLEKIDFILVMLAEAGAKGQEIQPENLEKVRAIHSQYPDLPIEVEAGINDMTARVAADAGAVRLVSTSFIFKDPANISRAIELLKRQ